MDVGADFRRRKLEHLGEGRQSRLYLQCPDVMERCFPSIAPRILQQHRADSHFQDADTWTEYIKKFGELVSEVRRVVAFDRGTTVEEQRALFVFDMAPQHSLGPVEALGFVDVVHVPGKMTHIFQPADQFVITNLRKHSEAAYGRFIEDVAAKYDQPTAARIIAGDDPPPAANGGKPDWTKAGFQRAKKYEFLAAAIDNLSESTILKSWERTGIVRALLGVGGDVLFDKYVPLAAEDVVLDEIGLNLKPPMP